MLNNSYKKNGFIISEKLISDDEISRLRNDLDKEFLDKDSKVQKNLKDFKNLDLAKKIINLYSSTKILNIVKNLKKNLNKNVALLPPFEVHKNYHVDLRQVHGWHRDCGGELKYDYCKKILFKKDYLFSKIGIYLQNNSDYGGGIDVIQSSHKNFSKLTSIIRKLKSIPFRITILFHKFLNKIYMKLPERFFMFILNAKKICPEKGSAVIFDSRIIHRGSPISKEKIKEIKFVEGEFQAFLPKEHDKFSIYCQLGTTESIDSYMFDRLKREDGLSELRMWLEHAEFLAKYNRELYNDISDVLEPIKKKYANFIN